MDKKHLELIKGWYPKQKRESDMESNIDICYEKLPNVDEFLTVWIENKNIREVLPDFASSTEYCLCIYGTSETDLENRLCAVKKYADEIKACIESRGITCCDIEIKPIFLFARKEDADIFIEFANNLMGQDFFDFIYELRHDYNIAWTSAQQFDNRTVYDIIEHYQGRFEND